MPGAQVLRQQHLPGTPFEALEAHGVAHELHPTGLEIGDAGDGDEELAVGDPDHDPGHGRVRGEAQLHDEVLDPPQAVPVPVDERALDHAGQVQDLDGHPWRSSSGVVRKTALQPSGRARRSMHGAGPCVPGEAPRHDAGAVGRLRPGRDPWEADRP